MVCVVFYFLETGKCFRHITQANFTIFVFSLSGTSFIIFIRQICKIESQSIFNYFKDLLIIENLITGGTLYLSLSNCTSSVTKFVVSVENISHLRLNLISTQLDDRGYDKLLCC